MQKRIIMCKFWPQKHSENGETFQTRDGRPFKAGEEAASDWRELHHDSVALIGELSDTGWQGEMFRCAQIEVS